MAMMVTYQDGEKGVDVAPNGAKDPLLLDRRDQDTREDAKGEDQIAQRHAKHQSSKRNENNKKRNPHDKLANGTHTHTQTKNSAIISLANQDFLQ